MLMRKFQNLQLNALMEAGTVFSPPEELDVVFAPFTNRPLTLLLNFSKRSTALLSLHIEQGYITSGALGHRSLKGAWRLFAIEGSLSAINVIGTRRVKS